MQNNVTQEAFIKVLSDYVIQLSEKLDSDSGIEPYNKVQDFPSFNSLMNNNVLNWYEVARNIANYGYAQVKYSDLLAEIKIKQSQARIYIHSLLNMPSAKSIMDSINFYIARITELSEVIRIRIDSIKESVLSLRSLKADAPK
jgi:hypothetical protein